MIIGKTNATNSASGKREAKTSLGLGAKEAPQPRQPGLVWSSIRRYDAPDQTQTGGDSRGGSDSWTPSIW